MTRNRDPYIIDTSAVIALYRERYPRRIFESLWNDIDSLVETGKLLTVNKVVAELESSREGSDLASDVARENLEMFVWASKALSKIEDLDEGLADEVEVRGIELSTIHRDWIEKPDVADPFVIAAAEILEGTVVSDERGRHSLQSLESHKQIDGVYPRETKIPSVCELIGVNHLNLVEMFEAEGWNH